MKDIAIDLNTIGAFCGVRDLSTLSRQALKATYQLEQVDVMVLFGGSILCGADLLAQAIRANVARHYIIVGGAGHTTQTLREQMQQQFSDWTTEEQAEAVLFQQYLKQRHHLQADYLETKSTNCGNNITLLLELLQQEGIPCNSIILSQDATMQRRMSATLRKYRPDWKIINYATYQVEVILRGGMLTYVDTPMGMWDVARYANLLLGEIPRLTDDAEGYGPKGQNFIAHVDIPELVANAFGRLTRAQPFSVRQANPAYR